MKNPARPALVSLLFLLPACGGSVAADPESQGGEPAPTASPSTDPTDPPEVPAPVATNGPSPGKDPAPPGVEPSPPGTNPSPPETPPAPPAKPPAAGTVILKTDFFDIPPGGEAFKCQNFANPFGKDVDILVSESNMTSGSHHMFVFREPGAVDGPVTDCSGLEFKGYIHSAQTPVQKQTYPEGVGRFLSGGEGLRIMAHYLNTTGDTLHAQVEISMQAVDPTEVQAHAAEIFLNKIGLRVSPGRKTESASYTTPIDIKILAGVSHMHQRGVHFLATTSDGRTIYEGSDWDEPEPAVFPEGLDVFANTRIDFSCDYQNDTGRTLTFGESAATNEMCIFSGTYFPAPNGQGISAQIFF